MATIVKYDLHQYIRSTLIYQTALNSISLMQHRDMAYSSSTAGSITRIAGIFSIVIFNGCSPPHPSMGHCTVWFPPLRYLLLSAPCNPCLFLIVTTTENHCQFVVPATFVFVLAVGTVTGCSTGGVVLSLTEALSVVLEAAFNAQYRNKWSSQWFWQVMIKVDPGSSITPQHFFTIISAILSRIMLISPWVKTSAQSFKMK